MHKIHLLIYTFLLLSSVSGICQDKPAIIIHGMVRNASSGEPIPYATIRLTGRAITTMTNEKGSFIFKIPTFATGDSLYITHVGYLPRAMAIDSFATGSRVITLHESANQLPSIVVNVPNPLDLIRKAVNKIPENYPAFPFRLTGFYRLYGTRERKIIDLSEAVFHIYSDGYSGKTNQFRLVKSRLDKDLTAFNGSDQINMGWKPAGITSFDFVNNPSDWEFLSKEAANEYKFSYKGLVDYNGREAFLIIFEEKEGVKKSLNNGRLFLGADDLAFLEVDLTRNQQGLKYYDEWGRMQRLFLSMSHISIKLLSDTISISYRKNGTKYYLNHVSANANYYVAGGNKHYLLNPLSVKTNYLVTSIDTAEVQPFSKDEVMKDKASIEAWAKVLNETTDSPDKSDTTDQFWGSYNLIEAEFNVDSAIRVIQANNSTLNYKKALESILRTYQRDKSARIDTILSFYHQKDQFNGGALVQYEGKVVLKKGFGMADQALNKPITEESQFRIGSTSKQFTAMLIIQLLKEGKLSIDDSAGKFLTGFKNGRVTIRQLLTHQSGIPNYTDNQETLEKIMERKYTLDELVYRFCSDSLEFEPGTRFSYTNSGFTVLADIIEKVRGKKYAEVLAEQIFIPLGMRHSFFVSGGDTANLAKGYINGQTENPYPVENVTGAGGITSSAADLLRWANALSSNTLLPKDMMDEIFKPRVAWDEWNAYYGYGWMIDRHIFKASDKHIIQYHPGIEFGFHDILLRQPDKRIVIILLNNSGDFPRFDITDLILNQLN